MSAAQPLAGLRLDALHLSLGQYGEAERPLFLMPVRVRRNGDERVARPEWRRGATVVPERAPLCIPCVGAAGRKLRVWAYLSAIPGLGFGERDLCVRAEIVWVARVGQPSSEGDPHVVVRKAPLASTEEVRVVISDERSGQPVACDFPSAIGDWVADVGVGVYDVCVAWRYGERRPRDRFATIVVRVYVILDRPRSPWVDADLQSAEQAGQAFVPWSACLDYACSWAASATDSAGVLSGLVSGLHASSPNLLEYAAGDSAYWAGFVRETVWFRPDKFVSKLSGPTDDGPAEDCHIDCTGAALTVHAFAALLGLAVDVADNDFDDQLTVSSLRAPVFFESTDVFPLGRERFHQFRFYYHAVVRQGDIVYDAAFRLSKEPPCDRPTTPVVAADGVDNEFYLRRLAEAACSDDDPVDEVSAWWRPIRFCGLVVTQCFVLTDLEDLIRLSARDLSLDGDGFAWLRRGMPTDRSIGRSFGEAVARSAGSFRPVQLEVLSLPEVTQLSLLLVRQGPPPPPPGWSYQPHCDYDARTLRLSMHVATEHSEGLIERLLSNYSGDRPERVDDDVSPPMYVFPSADHVPEPHDALLDLGRVVVRAQANRGTAVLTYELLNALRLLLAPLSTLAPETALE